VKAGRDFVKVALQDARCGPGAGQASGFPQGDLLGRAQRAAGRRQRSRSPPRLWQAEPPFAALGAAGTVAPNWILGEPEEAGIRHLPQVPEQAAESSGSNPPQTRAVRNIPPESLAEFGNLEQPATGFEPTSGSFLALPMAWMRRPVAGPPPVDTRRPSGPRVSSAR
jgi:hypothetical protein